MLQCPYCQGKMPEDKFDAHLEVHMNELENAVEL